MNIQFTKGSTGLLFTFALLYFGFYTIFGLGLKYAQGPVSQGLLGLGELSFLIYSTFGSALVCLGVIALAGWWRFKWWSREGLLMVISGTCTALVIPTTTLMYSLPLSVMIAMVIMRGSVILISRLLDELFLAMGISHKKVSWEENLAVLFAVGAVSLSIFRAGADDFLFFRSSVATTILAVYLAAYGLRLFLMNRFKFLFGFSPHIEKQNYFALEQLVASLWIFGTLGIALLFSPWPTGHVFGEVAFSLLDPPSNWQWALLIGIPFGGAAFFSVFLFMFEGRTSTFGALVNRCSSLFAGTISTLLFAYFFGGKWPSAQDWMAFGVLLAAVLLLARSERRSQNNEGAK
jgi:hypothetical protein